jgi:hypothetical protein
VRQLEEHYTKVKEEFKQILIASYEVIGQFLAEVEPESFVSNVSRYTYTRKVSSKINAVLTSLVLNYTNSLIHHLLKAGEGIETDWGT